MGRSPGDQRDDSVEKPLQQGFALAGSNGGRGAFNAAAKYPGEYDGVVAVAPSRNIAGLASAWMEFGPASILTPGKIATVKNAAVAACDRLDGLVDLSLIHI